MKMAYFLGHLVGLLHFSYLFMPSITDSFLVFRANVNEVYRYL